MARYINYPRPSAGDGSDMIGRVMGPDLAKAHYVVVDTVLEDDRLRVGLVPMPASEPRLYLDDHRQMRIQRDAIVDGRIAPLPLGITGG